MSRKIIDIASLFTRSRSIQTCSTFGFTSTLSSSFNSLMPRNQRTYLTIKSDSIPSFKKCIGRSSSTLIPLIRYSRNYSSKPKIGLNIDKDASNNISNPNPSSPKFSIKSIMKRNRFTLKREDIYTIPNYLTVARLALSPLILYLITINAYTSALAVLSFAAVTDVLDGWIARTWKCGTALGSVLDPLADKVLMSVLVVGLSSVGLIPSPLGLLIIARDVGLIIGTSHVRYMSLPEPKTLSRYFDLTLPTAEVHPPFISKLNTLLQVVLMWSSLASPVFGFVDSIFMEALQYLVAGTTIWSGLHYFFVKDVVKVFGKDWRK